MKISIGSPAVLAVNFGCLSVGFTHQFNNDLKTELLHV